MPVCDNCEETVPALVDYHGDTVCERCAAEWEERDMADARSEFFHGAEHHDKKEGQGDG